MQRADFMVPHARAELTDALATAKSRQDVRAALRLLHPDMRLVTPAFGSEAVGLAENEHVLRRFFDSFPDYQVVLEGRADDGETLACWGTARMTMTGDRFGVTPNGQRATIGVMILFTFRDGLIASERFCFDLAELCDQSGVSTDAVRCRLFAGRAHVTEPSGE